MSSRLHHQMAGIATSAVVIIAATVWVLAIFRVTMAAYLIEGEYIYAPMAIIVAGGFLLEIFRK